MARYRRDMSRLSIDDIAEGVRQAARRRNERLALVERITAPPPRGVDPDLAEELDRVAAEMFGTPTPARNRQGTPLRIKSWKTWE